MSRTFLQNCSKATHYQLEKSLTDLHQNCFPFKNFLIANQVLNFESWINLHGWNFSLVDFMSILPQIEHIFFEVQIFIVLQRFLWTFHLHVLFLWPITNISSWKIFEEEVQTLSFLWMSSECLYAQNSFLKTDFWTFLVIWTRKLGVL